MKLSIRIKFLLLFTAVPTVAILLYMFFVSKLFVDDKLAYIFDSSLTHVRSTQMQIQSELEGAQENLRKLFLESHSEKMTLSSLGHSLFQQNPDIQFFSIYEKSQSKPQQIKALFTITKSNNLKEEVLKTIGSDQAPSAKDPVTLYLSTTRSDLLFLEITRTHLVKQDVPDDSANQQIIVLGFPSQNFLKIFRKNSFFSTYLVSNSGLTLLGNLETGSLKFVDWPFFSKIDFNLTPEGVMEASSPSGEPFIVSFFRDEMSQLITLSLVEKNRVMAGASILYQKSWVYIAAILAICVIIGVLTGHQLTYPIKIMDQAAKEIVKGNFDLRLHINTGDELQRLSESFNQMAQEVLIRIKLEKEKARVDKELETVQYVQKVLFPKFDTSFGSLRIAGFYETAVECGGDWWYYSEIGDLVYLWIGDATGHGMGPAFITAAARSAASVIEVIPNISPAKILAYLNRSIYEFSRGEIMMTFFVAAINKKTGQMTYANASHESPFIITSPKGLVKRDQFEVLEGPNSPRLGESLKSEYKESNITLNKDSVLVLFTDGVMDISNAEKKNLRERGFLNLLAKSISHYQNPKSSISRLHSFFTQYRDKTPLADDAAVLICDFFPPT